MRSPEEIAEEIKALKSIKLPAALGIPVARRIALAIAELESPGQFCKDESDWPIFYLTRTWMFGETRQKPSEGWPKEKP